MGKVIYMKDYQRKFSFKDLVFVFPLLFLMFLGVVIFIPVGLFILFVLPADTPPSYLYGAFISIHAICALFALAVFHKDLEREHRLSWTVLILAAPLIGPMAYLARKWVG